MPKTATSSSISEIKNALRALEKIELIALIEQLYKLNADNKVFLSSRLIEQSAEELSEPYRKAIREQFNPARGFPKLSLRSARKALTDFKKASNNPTAQIDLMLYYVEQGVICTNNYGDINEGFYNSLESVYVDAIKLIRELDSPEISEQFRQRASNLVTQTRNIGWGFHDALAEMYEGDYPNP